MPLLLRRSIALYVVVKLKLVLFGNSVQLDRRDKLVCLRSFLQNLCCERLLSDIVDDVVVAVLVAEYVNVFGLDLAVFLFERPSKPAWELDDVCLFKFDEAFFNAIDKSVLDERRAVTNGTDSFDKHCWFYTVVRELEVHLLVVVPVDDSSDTAVFVNP